MQIERVEQFSTATLSKTWTDPATGTIVDPGTVTVTITRADGTIVATNAATTGGGAAARTYTLTATTLLDWLNVTWTSATYGSRRPDRVEVVGGYVFSVADGLAATTGVTADDIINARLYAEDELERAVGYALVPRYAQQTIVRRWRQAPRLTWPYVRAIRSATIDGTAITGADLTAILPAPGGLVGGPFGGTWQMRDCFDGWYGTSWSTVVIGYEHGLDGPSPGATRAALQLVQDYTGGDTSIDQRAESIVTVDGTIRLRTAGQFGLPAVDSFIASSRLPVIA